MSHYAPLVIASALAVLVLCLLALRLLCAPPGAALITGNLYYKQAVGIPSIVSSEQVKPPLFSQPYEVYYSRCNTPFT